MENYLFPLKVGLKWVFVNELKWVQQWVLGCKNGSKVGRNPRFTHFKPLSGFSRKPTSLASLRGWKLFSKKGPEAVPTQHNSFLGARLICRTATQRSKKGSEKVLEKASQKGPEKGGCYGFYSKKGF